MKQSILYKFFQTKLAMKIWLCLTGLFLGLLLLIGIALELFFRRYVEEDALNAAIRSTEHAADSFSAEYNRILNSFVTYTASTGFYDILTAIGNNSTDEYIELRTELPAYLSNYENISSFINTAMITASDGRLFHSYKFKRKEDGLPYTLTYDLTDAEPISVLASAESPFRGQSEVIPIAFLLRTTSSEQMVLLADNLEEAPYILYFFLNTQKVEDYLKLYYNNSETKSLLYLSDVSGNPVSISGNGFAGSTDRTAQAVRMLNETGESFLKTGDYYVIVRPIDNSDLCLVNVISQNELLTHIRRFDLVLLYMAAASLLLIPFLVVLLSRFVTRPLRLLVGSVKDIEANHYQTPERPLPDDEIGRLGRSIDSMYQTIQKQILQIKEEERGRFDMEMRLLSEQINPHFLYNTLECINMEIYNQHSENATAMITNLGGYLRLSLSYGKNQITIRQETERLKAYVNIMNYRFRHGIGLNLQTDPELMPMLILKSVLQPLVENSIKHGFLIDIGSRFPLSPCIEIRIGREEDQIVLSVTDNGGGIDIAKAERIMKEDGTDEEGGKHIGLNNIRQRLTAFYGSAEISFSSIPFYENRVLIRIPYESFLERQTRTGD